MLLAYYADISCVDPALAELSSLSNYRQEKLRHTRSPLARRQGIGAELLLNFALKAAEADIAFPPEIVTSEYGKPYLNGGNLFFSLSHSGNYAFCAIADCEIGADIQIKAAYDPKLADRFFTAGERAYISRAIDKDSAFLRVWTLKESYIKAVGRGLGIPLASFEALPVDECSPSLPGCAFWQGEKNSCFFAICAMGCSAVPDRFEEIVLS